MDFKTATDRLTERVTLADIAEACGSSTNLIERARLDSNSRHRREPPPNWKDALSRLARTRAQELLKIADEVVGADRLQSR